MFKKSPLSSTANTFESVVQPLPRMYRRWLFFITLLVFICTVPAFVFYAMGYRFNIFDTKNGLVAMGGLYVALQSDVGDIYVNDEPVRGSRLFRRATYIQNVAPGVQQVHVQFPGLHTWVKQVPVFPHIVTEVEAFLMPVVPQVRVITEYIDTSSRAVIPISSSATSTLALAASTNLFVLASTTSTSTYQANLEFAFIKGLFTPATNTATSTLNDRPFRFANEDESNRVIAIATTTVATSTVTRGSIVLYERDNQLFARYNGGVRNIPHYFCVPMAVLASTTELFGVHVAYEIERKLSGPIQIFDVAQNYFIYDTNQRICRNEIRIDTRFQAPRSFNFLPDTSDYVLLHLDEGVFVVEIDDRAWQNVQQVYPASAEQVIVDNNRIYIKEGGIFFELYTTLLTL